MVVYQYRGADFASIDVDISLTNDQNGYNIRAGTGYRNSINSFSNPSKKIGVTVSDLQNAEYTPPDLPTDFNLDSHLVDGQQQTLYRPSQDNLFEVLYVPINFSYYYFQQRFGSIACLFELFNIGKTENHAGDILFLGFTPTSTTERINATLRGHAVTYYEQQSESNNRETIVITRGDSESHTGYGFNRPPETNGNAVRFNIPPPPSVSRLKSDHVVFYSAALDGTDIVEQTKHQINRKYNDDLDFDRPVAQNRQTLIRREILYTDGTSHKTAYYQLNRVENKYFPNNKLGAGESGLVLNPDSPYGVFDELLITAPEINVGRCI